MPGSSSMNSSSATKPACTRSRHLADESYTSVRYSAARPVASSNAARKQSSRSLNIS